LINRVEHNQNINVLGGVVSEFVALLRWIGFWPGAWAAPELQPLNTRNFQPSLQTSEEA